MLCIRFICACIVFMFYCIRDICIVISIVPMRGIVVGESPWANAVPVISAIVKINASEFFMIESAVQR